MRICALASGRVLVGGGGMCACACACEQKRDVLVVPVGRGVDVGQVVGIQGLINHLGVWGHESPGQHSGPIRMGGYFCVSSLSEAVHHASAACVCMSPRHGAHGCVHCRMEHACYPSAGSPTGSP